MHGPDAAVMHARTLACTVCRAGSCVAALCCAHVRGMLCIGASKLDMQLAAGVRAPAALGLQCAVLMPACQYRKHQHACMWCREKAPFLRAAMPRHAEHCHFSPDYVRWIMSEVMLCLWPGRLSEEVGLSSTPSWFCDAHELACCLIFPGLQLQLCGCLFPVPGRLSPRHDPFIHEVLKIDSGICCASEML